MIFKEYLNDYSKFLAAKGYDQGTVNWRKSYLKLLFTYLEAREITSPKEVTRTHINNFRIFLKEEHRTLQGKLIASSTYGAYNTAMMDFFHWLEQTKQILISPVDKLPRIKKSKPDKLPQVLTEDETLKILETCQINTPTGLRDRAILEIFYSTGIRRRELLKLNIEDLNFESGELNIHQGKGRKDRIVPIGEYAIKFTEGYLKLVRPWMVKDSTEKALFISSMNGLRLNKGTVAYIVKKAVKKSGVKKRVTPHIFRHSMATHLLRNKADLRHIQAILGHSSARSTEVYTHLAFEDLKETIRDAHPHGRR
jgi:integrase/recombinase XerD